MTEVRAEIPRSPEEVFAVLADGWSYAHWVVGASHMRAVDADWPRVGSKIHHSVGLWPLTVEDSTVVLACDPPHKLELHARLWPFGQAWIGLELTPTTAHTTEVRMVETVDQGPARLLPGLLETAMLKPRNKESLSRLSDLVTAGYQQR
ncbi:SRPBCC family protein [Nocardia inohanensis]|uniref:SRPBCC family protein n=1 Tax=Nocardia inohanensis TaxID=209246 RepID=UPI000832B028|nr:SRPBCC family protein [Nocardia inohanensis]